MIKDAAQEFCFCTASRSEYDGALARRMSADNVAEGVHYSTGILRMENWGEPYG